MDHYCWFHISFDVFNTCIYRSVKYSPTWSKNTKSIFSHSSGSRLSEDVNTLFFWQIPWVWPQPVFKWKISSPTKKYGSGSKEQLVTVLGGGKLIAPDSNYFASSDFLKRPLSLLLPYSPISVRVKQYLASQAASRTKFKNSL